MSRVLCRCMEDQLLTPRACAAMTDYLVSDGYMVLGYALACALIRLTIGNKHFAIQQQPAGF